MIQHFIITRFNIASEGREAPIRNSPGWLDRRFELFERYCLPSVASQTVKQFNWLIYFDIATPATYRERIARAQLSFQFEARFVEKFGPSQAASDVTTRILPNVRTILTTRIDNDDAIARDFIERIQKEAVRTAPGSVLNFKHGLALCDGKVYTAADTSNPFTTLVESGDKPAETIWGARHRELGVKWNVRQVLGRPAWLQVVHGENVSNRIKGSRVGDKSATRAFELGGDVVVEPVSHFALLVDRTILFPARFIREAAIMAAKRLLRRR